MPSTVTKRSHRFKVGDHLRIAGGGNLALRRASGCVVVALLPDEGHGALRYRIRSDAESFERIVVEADLSLLSGADGA